MHGELTSYLFQKGSTIISIKKDKIEKLVLKWCLLQKMHFL